VAHSRDSPGANGIWSDRSYTGGFELRENLPRNAASFGDIDPIRLGPFTHRNGVVSGCRGGLGPSTDTAATGDIGLKERSQFVRVAFAEIELEELAVQSEPDRFVGTTAIQVVDQFDEGSLQGDLSGGRGGEFPPL
jgi:hypothetical protein